MVDDLLARRSEEQALEAAEAAPADDDRVCAGALLEKHIRRLSAFAGRFDVQCGPQLLHRRDGVVGDLLRAGVKDVQSLSSGA